MLVLVIGETILVVLLGVLVAGLLRSHADILRALRDLGAPVGDPARAADPAGPVRVADPFTPRRNAGGSLEVGPRLPADRGREGHDLTGVTPEGDAVALALVGVDQHTLVAFLSSGCASCARFFEALEQPTALPEGVRPVIAVKGPEAERPAEVASRVKGKVPVVMSSEAWADYEVPGSPFFVLVEGPSGQRIGEGSASNIEQVAALVRAAVGDRTSAPGPREVIGGDRDDPERVDAELRAAGVLPGDPRLHPRSVADLEPPAEAGGRAWPGGRGEPAHPAR